MPGAFGIVSADTDAPPDLALAERMRAILRHSPTYKDYLLESPGCVLGGTTPAYYNAIIEPALSRDGNLCLIMEGEIYNAEELQTELRAAGFDDEAANAAQMMLRLYEAYGDDLAHKVNALFILAIWDKRERRLTIINDRVGLYLLHYYQDASRFVFAPEMKALLCDPKLERKIDPDAVADFFTFGSIFGERTFVSGVKVMPPGTVLQYRAGKLKQRKYWDFPFAEPRTPASAREYIEELDAVLRNVSRRHTKDRCRYGLSLSGGRDSRIVAGYLAKTVSPLHSFTFGNPASDEVQLAQRMASSLGCHFHHVDKPREDLLSCFEKVVWLTEGPINTPEYYQLGKAMATEVDVAFNGHAGDVLGGRWVTPAITRARDIAAVMEETYTRYSRRLGDHASGGLFSGSLRSRVQGAARRNFGESFDDLRHEKPAHAQLKQEMRTKNWREYTRVNDVPRLFARYRYPFFDYDVLDFFLRLPTEMRRHEKIYLGVLISKFPDLAKVPYPNRRYSLRAEYLYLGPYYRFRNKVGHLVVKKFYKSLRGLAPSSTVDYIDGVYLQPSPNPVLDLILHNNYSSSYFDPDYLRSVVAAHAARKADHSFLLHKLVTFMLYNRMLIQSAQPEGPEALLI